MVNQKFDLTKLNTFPKLIEYLKEELDWPIEDEVLDDLTFDYAPGELGIDEEHHVNIKSIQQLRPLSNNQPWGIFFIDFESKKLPIVLLRRLLSALVPKNRASSQSSNQPTWNLDDLLFVSLLGEEQNRQVCFSHFKKTEVGLPVLQTFSWDETETHLFYLKKFNLESLRWPDDVNNADDWKSNWSYAFTAFHGQIIKNSKELSVELAKIAKSIRHTVYEIYKYESEKGHYHNLLAMFKEALIHNLKPDDFSDMVAQTITYGLFSAAAPGDKLTSLNNLSSLIPNTNPFLKSLFDELTANSDNKQKVNFDELGLNDLIDILNETDINGILQQFGRQTSGGREDPVIHFYEDFLKEYDKQEKVEKGVFYTPKPVVSFIVRSIHEMIIDEYGLEDGLADISTWVETVKKNPGLKKPPNAKLTDPFVQILDPAVGTGTFLVEVIDIIYHTMISKWKNAGGTKKEIGNKWNDYVNTHLIPRIYGFELMMAPYSICHVKLGLKLKETGFNPKYAKSRFNIFLTNTLEEPEDLETALFKPFLAIESDEANQVKLNTPISIILGNPPYSGESSNKGKWIMNLMEAYKKEPGETEKLKEKNSKFINDDYVKFIRCSQYFINRTGIGIIAFINNNGFIDNPTFRGMRWNLASFNENIYVLDLHGSSKKKEKNPSGGSDDNVFDIQQGVSINIFKRGLINNGDVGKVYHSEIFGTREKKYKILNSNSFKKINYEEIELLQPDNYFINRDLSEIESYNYGIPLTDIFMEYSLGVLSKNDSITISFSENELEKNINILMTNSENNSREILNIKKDSRDWVLSKAINDLKENYSSLNYKNIIYRPFDIRSTYFTGKTKGFFAYSQNRIMRNFKNDNNYAIITGRQGQAVGQMQWNLSFITNTISDQNIFRRGGGTVMPLFLYKKRSNQQDTGLLDGRILNINRSILDNLSNGLKLDFEEEIDASDRAFSPLDIFDYIYSVIHSNVYRDKYKVFLKTDFPRIPFTKNIDVFRKMCKFGSVLRKIHLLENQKIKQFITKYPQDGDNTITRPEYMEDKVFINKDQYFDGVPELAWNFYIGGYQPAQKWLKDRKGRKLSTEDIEHYQKIIVVLTETDRIMKEIDKVYPEVEKDLIQFKLDDLMLKDDNKTKKDKNQKIFDLIKKGEGTKIEFKATLQKSIDNPNIPLSVIENEVLGTLAAFCNTEGGSLLIGVKDDGQIIGIEQDNFKNNDKFKNHLKNIVNARLTKSVFQNINTEFFTIKGLTVCLITCTASDNPIFTEFEGSSQFYVRKLESTDSLGPKEMFTFCKDRFNN